MGRSSLTEGSLAFGAATSFSLVCLRLTGHIGIAVPDVHAACELFKEQGVTFVKKPDDGETRALPPRPGTVITTLCVSSGKMKGLAFIQDPDGYWIEILSPNTMLSITS